MLHKLYTNVRQLLLNPTVILRIFRAVAVLSLYITCPLTIYILFLFLKEKKTLQRRTIRNIMCFAINNITQFWKLDIVHTYARIFSLYSYKDVRLWRQNDGFRSGETLRNGDHGYKRITQLHFSSYVDTTGHHNRFDNYSAYIDLFVKFYVLHFAARLAGNAKRVYGKKIIFTSTNIYNFQINTMQRLPLKFTAHRNYTDFVQKAFHYR